MLDNIGAENNMTLWRFVENVRKCQSAEVRIALREIQLNKQKTTSISNFCDISVTDFLSQSRASEQRDQNGAGQGER